MGVTSIFTNDFYNKKPVPTWLFEMDFTNLFLYQPDNNYADTLAKAAVSCNWPERIVNTIPVYYAGVEGKLPGRVQNSGDLEIKFNENETFIVTKILEELYHAEASCDAYFEGKGAYSFNKDFNKTRRMIRMILHSPNYKNYVIDPKKENLKKRPVVIEYHNCWLSKISPQEMNYENDTETITRTGTFTYDYFKVLGSGETKINDTCAGDKL